MIKHIFYKGEEIDIKDLHLIWTDHFGRYHDGDMDDYRNSEVDDAVIETEAGDGW